MLLMIILCSYLLWAYLLLWFVTRGSYNNVPHAKLVIPISIVISPLMLLLVTPVIVFFCIKKLFTKKVVVNNMVPNVIPTQEDFDKEYEDIK